VGSRVVLAGFVFWFGVPLTSGTTVADEYVQWKMVDYAIDQPLGGLKGDARRGRQLVRDRSKGNCLACHRMPIPEEEFHGTVGPSLHGISSRLSEGQIRLRVVDEKQLNPASIMPGYYRHPRHFNRVAESWQGKTVLNAQEVEDIVAYLLTLKDEQP